MQTGVPKCTNELDDLLLNYRPLNSTFVLMPLIFMKYIYDDSEGQITSCMHTPCVHELRRIRHHPGETKRAYSKCSNV